MLQLRTSRMRKMRPLMPKPTSSTRRAACQGQPTDLLVGKKRKKMRWEFLIGSDSGIDV